MGLGHIVRSGAVADMINEDWECVLFTRCNIPEIIDEARNAFREIIIIPDETTSDQELDMMFGVLRSGDIVVLDGYHFQKDYQERVRAEGALLLCIDDIHAFDFRANAILNSAGDITPFDYHALPSTWYFLGPAYTMLRKPFLQKASERQGRIFNKDVFVCLGGADPGNATLEVLEFLESFQLFDQFKIVTGAGYQFGKELDEYIAQKTLRVSVYRSLPAAEMADLMASCSFAVCSPSTVAYEYMTIGGVVFLQQIADNQGDMLEYLTKAGLAFHLRDFGRTIEPAWHQSLLRQGEVFDGNAGPRIKGIFEKLEQSRHIRVRNVEKEDIGLCYGWANDQSARRLPFNSEPIPFATHEKWFQARIVDPQTYFYILEMNGSAVAQIRFQVKDREAVLSYLVDHAFRGRGLGILVLSKGIESFVRDYGQPVKIIGFVKISNPTSRHSFEGMKFSREIATDFDATYKYSLNYDGN